MKIEQKPRDDHQANLIVECDQEQLELFSTKAAQKISRESKIPGFRPGKAPVSVVRRMYGDDYIQNRAVELLVDDIYPKILDESGIKPSGPGSLQEVISVNPPKFSFLVPLEPTIDLKDYLSIRKEYTPPTLDESEVKKTLAEFQRMLAVAEPVERPAAKGDMVYLKIAGTIQDPSEGQDPVAIKQTDTQVWIGNESENDPFPYKGFEKELIRLSANEKKSVNHKFAKDTPYTELQDKTIQFDLEVLSVKFMKLPEMDDNFAKSLGDFNSYNDLVESIRTRLTERNQDEYDQKYFDDLLEEITAQSVISYPPQMLDDETEHLLEHFKEDLAAQKLDLDTYLKMNEKTIDQFTKDELNPSARKRLERSLVLEQIAKQENIQVSQEEITQELNLSLSNLENSEDFKKLSRKSNSQQLMNAMAMQAAGRAMNRRVLNLIKSIATGEYKKEENKTTDAGVEVKKTSKKTTSKKVEKTKAGVEAKETVKPVKKASTPAKKSKEKNEK